MSMCMRCGHGLGFHDSGCYSCRARGMDECSGFTRRVPRNPDAPIRVRIGFRMRMIADFVSATPGCSKADALRGADLPERGLGSYHPIDRTARAGLIIIEQGEPGAPYRLFASERDRAIWHLRDELLHSQPTPERALEIRAQVESLRAEAAQDYATGTAKDLA